jgi:hypothetical protein
MVQNNMPPEGEPKSGRPREEKHREFTERELRLITALYEMGTTDQDIASTLGIKRPTLILMMQRQGITDTIKAGKGSANRKVMAALYNSATGYDYTEEHFIRDTGTKIEVRKHQPGSDTARIFWLCNREPEEWQSLSRVINERPKGDIEAEVQAWADKILQLQGKAGADHGHGAAGRKAAGHKKAGRK